MTYCFEEAIFIFVGYMLLLNRGGLFKLFSAVAKAVKEPSILHTSRLSSAHTHQYINQETKKYSHYCTLLVGVKNDSVVDWLYSSYGMER